MRQFNIPQKAEDLEQECDDVLHVYNSLDASSLGDAQEVASRAQELLFQLSNNDALHATSDQECFDNMYYTVKAFDLVPSADRAKLLECLCSNLADLADSVTGLMSGGISCSDSLACQHRSAIQLHAFMLNWILLQAEASAAQGELEQRQADAGKKGARARKAGGTSKSAGAFNEWDLGRGRENAMKEVSKLLGVDFTPLFSAEHEKQRLVDTCIQMAARAIESPDAMKRPETKQRVIDVLVLAAVKHDKLANVAETLVSTCRRMEHVPEIATLAAIQAQEQHSCSRLAEQMISEFTLTSPALYDKEPEKHPGVKHLGDLLAFMAESQALAKVVAGQLPLLEPYLACGNESIRCAIVHILGALLAEVFAEADPATAGRDQTARITSKEKCMTELLMRLMDISARVRTRTLKAWAMLVFEDKLPLPWWPMLLKAVQLRLLDGKTTVVKAALQLYQVMLENAPFGAQLNVDRMQATIQDMEAELKARGPQPGDDEQGEEGASQPVGGEGGAEGQEGGAAWSEGGALQVGEQRARNSTAMGEGAGDAGAPGADAGAGEDQEMADADAQPPTPSQGQGTDVMQPSQTQGPGGSLFSLYPVVSLRTSIATLKTGIEFVRIIESSATEIHKLLTVHDAGNIKDAIHLLTLWKQKGVANADETLRGTWALIFLRDEAVRAAVVDAFYNQYLVSPQGQRGTQAGLDLATRVLSVAHGTSQGEAAALEEILRLLCTPGGTGSADAGLSPMVVSHIIWHMKESFNAMVQLQQRMAALQQKQHNSNSAASGAAALPHSPAAPAARPSDGDGDGAAQAASDDDEDEGALRTRYSYLASVLHSAVGLAATVATHNPSLAQAAKLEPAPLLRMLQGALTTLKDAWVVRHCCVAIKALAPQIRAASANGEHASGLALGGSGGTQRSLLEVACQLLVQVLVSCNLGQQNWPSAAGAALSALYALHPSPSTLITPLLKALLARALSGTITSSSSGANRGPDSSSVSGAGHSCVLFSAAALRPEQPALQLSEAEMVRLLFLTGHVAMHQLVLIEGLVKEIRRRRHEHERTTNAQQQHHAEEEETEEQPASSSTSTHTGEGRRKKKGVDSEEAEREAAAKEAAAKEQEDIGQQLGCGSVAADAALDALQEQLDAQILGTRASLLGLLGHGFVVPCCRDMQLLLAHPAICETALMALSKLMAVDATFCETHMQLLFTRLSNRALGPAARSNLVIALGDLAVRFPNITEPWTAHMYAPLSDADVGVRRTSLNVLGHLILNSMMKVKGNIARLALRLVDEEEELRVWARRFFATLAQRSSGTRSGSNPIYNLLPDIMSALVREPSLDQAGFEAIMKVLLPYVKDSRQADAFKDKLCQRFEALQEVSVASAADFANAKQAQGDDAAAAAAAAAGGDSGAPDGDCSAHVQHTGDAVTRGALDPGSTATAEGAAAACAPADAQPGEAPASVQHSPAHHTGSEGVRRGGSPAASGDSFFSACSAGAEATSHRSASHASHAQGGPEVSSGDVQSDNPACAPHPPQPAAGGGSADPAAEQGGACEEGAAGTEGGSWGCSDGTASSSQQQQQQQQQQQPNQGQQHRGPCGMSSVVEEWRALAVVLKGMGYSEKGLRLIMDRRRCYKHALGDEEVYKVFWSMAEEGRKKASKDSTLKEDATNFRNEIEEVHKALRLGKAEDASEDGEQEEGAEQGQNGSTEEDPAAAAAAADATAAAQGEGTQGAAADGDAEMDDVQPAAGPPAAQPNRRRGRAQRDQDKLQQVRTQRAEAGSSVRTDCEEQELDEDALCADTPSGKPPRSKRAAHKSTPVAMKVKPGQLVGQPRDGKRAEAAGGAAAAAAAAAAGKKGRRGAAGGRGGRRKVVAPSSSESEGGSSSSAEEEEEEEEGADAAEGDDDGASSRDQQTAGLEAQAKRLGKVQLSGGARRIAVKQEPDT